MINKEFPSNPLLNCLMLIIAIYNAKIAKLHHKFCAGHTIYEFKKVSKFSRIQNSHKTMLNHLNFRLRKLPICTKICIKASSLMLL